jgi:hypothetical protein
MSSPIPSQFIIGWFHSEPTVRQQRKQGTPHTHTTHYFREAPLEEEKERDIEQPASTVMFSIRGTVSLSAHFAPSTDLHYSSTPQRRSFYLTGLDLFSFYVLGTGEPLFSFRGRGVQLESRDARQVCACGVSKMSRMYVFFPPLDLSTPRTIRTHTHTHC